MQNGKNEEEGSQEFVKYTREEVASKAKQIYEIVNECPPAIAASVVACMSGKELSWETFNDSIEAVDVWMAKYQEAHQKIYKDRGAFDFVSFIAGALASHSYMTIAMDMEMLRSIRECLMEKSASPGLMDQAEKAAIAIYVTANSILSWQMAFFFNLEFAKRDCDELKDIDQRLEVFGLCYDKAQSIARAIFTDIKEVSRPHDADENLRVMNNETAYKILLKTMEMAAGEFGYDLVKRPKS